MLAFWKELVYPHCWSIFVILAYEKAVAMMNRSSRVVEIDLVEEVVYKLLAEKYLSRDLNDEMRCRTYQCQLTSSKFSAMGVILLRAMAVCPLRPLMHHRYPDYLSLFSQSIVSSTLLLARRTPRPGFRVPSSLNGVGSICPSKSKPSRRRLLDYRWLC